MYNGIFFNLNLFREILWGIENSTKNTKVKLSISVINARYFITKETQKLRIFTPKAQLDKTSFSKVSRLYASNEL